MDIAAWLEGLGLRQHEDAFRGHHIGGELLATLTAADLREMGITSLGHRKTLLAAIAALPSTVDPPPAPVARSAERRQLTVMFVDLVGSTALSQCLDPEEMGEVLRAYRSAVLGELARFEGHVARFMGDGVLAYFGWPRAQEDAAERAVRAGLAIAEAVGRLSAPTDAELVARVGIATGLVVVGELVGHGTAKEETVVGEAPNLAARLQALASPGAVVIASNTRRLAGGLFEYADLGERRLKGFTARVRAWRVLGEGRVESRFEALRAPVLTQLIDRERELELLFDLWTRAKGGAGQVVLISGEPGIGKSRLAQALTDALAGEQHAHVGLYCSPQHRSSPLHPVISYLKRVARLEPGDPSAQSLARLEILLAQATEDIGVVVPLLAALLEIPIEERYPPLDLSPQQQREQTLETLVNRVEALAARQPVLVMFEDVHWADPSSLELLGRLLERVQHLSVLMLVTFRPEFVPPWAENEQIMALSLGRLSRQQSRMLVERVAGGQRLSAGVLEQILVRTDGVPLFTEELTRAVLEGGLLADQGRPYELEASLPSTLVIPASLQDSLMARLDRLASLKEVAQIAACIGREFGLDLLSAVAPMPLQELIVALDQFAAAQLIHRSTTLDATYAFKHVLVQEAAYNSLLKSRRQQLHAHIADVLEGRFSDIVATQPEFVARHCEEAGLAERAIGHWFAAGQRSLTRSAMVEAAAQFQNGLDLLPALTDGAVRHQHEPDLLIGLGRALVATKGFATPFAGKAFARAGELCRKPSQALKLVSVLYGQWEHHLARAELKQSQQLAEKIGRLGGTWNDPALKLVGALYGGQVWFFLGAFSKARIELEGALSLQDSEQCLRYTELPVADARISTVAWLARSLTSLGHREKARLWTDTALAEAQKCAHGFTLAFVLAHAWHAAWTPTAPQAVLPLAGELERISVKQGFSLYAAVGAILRGWSLALMGRGDGLTSLEEGLAAYRATGAVLYLPFHLTLLADAYRVTGRLAEGLECLAEAATLVKRTGERWAEAELQRVKGELLIKSHDLLAAEVILRQAVAVARRQGSKLAELRAGGALARLLCSRGGHVNARKLLESMTACVAECEATSELRDVQTLLEELTAR